MCGLGVEIFTCCCSLQYTEKNSTGVLDKSVHRGQPN